MADNPNSRGGGFFKKTGQNVSNMYAAGRGAWELRKQKKEVTNRLMTDELAEKVRSAAGGGSAATAGGAQIPGGAQQGQESGGQKNIQVQSSIATSSAVSDPTAFNDLFKSLEDILLRGGVRETSQPSQNDPMGQDNAETTQHFMRAALANDLFAAAVAHEPRSTESGARLFGNLPTHEEAANLPASSRGMTNDEMLQELHRSLTPQEEEDYKTAKSMSGSEGVRQTLSGKLRSGRMGSAVSDLEMDVIVSTIFGFDWDSREARGAWPPEISGVPSDSAPVPTPPNAFVDFVVENAFDIRAEGQRGLFVGSVFKHTSARKSIGDDETGSRPLLSQETASAILARRAGAHIEKVVARFRALVFELYSTPRNEMCPTLKVPGMACQVPPEDMADELAGRFRKNILKIPKCNADFDKVAEKFKDKEGVRNPAIERYVKEIESVFQAWKIYAESVQAIRDEQIKNTTSAKGDVLIPLETAGADTLKSARDGIRAQIADLKARIGGPDGKSGEKDMPDETKKTLLVILEVMNQLNTGQVHFSSPKEGINALIEKVKTLGSFSSIKDGHVFPVWKAAKIAVDELRESDKESERGKLSPADWIIALGVMEAPNEGWNRARVEKKGKWDRLLDRIAMHKIMFLPIALTVKVVKWFGDGILVRRPGFPYAKLSMDEIPIVEKTPMGTFTTTWSKIDQEAASKKREGLPFWKRHPVSWHVPLPHRNPDPSHNWFRRNLLDWQLKQTRVFGIHSWNREMTKKAIFLYATAVVWASCGTIRNSDHAIPALKAHFWRFPPLTAWVDSTTVPSDHPKVVYGGNEMIPQLVYALDNKRESSQDGLTEREYYLHSALLVGKGIEEPKALTDARAEYSKAIQQSGAYITSRSLFGTNPTTHLSIPTVVSNPIKISYTSMTWLPLGEKRVNFDAPMVRDAEAKLIATLAAHRASPEYKESKELLAWLSQPENRQVVQFMQERLFGKRLIKWAPVPEADQCKTEQGKKMEDGQRAIRDAKEALDNAKKKFKEDSPEVKKATEDLAKAEEDFKNIQKSVDLSKSGAVGATICNTVVMHIEDLANPYRLDRSAIDKLVSKLRADQASGVILDTESLNKPRRLEELYKLGLLLKRAELMEMQAFGFSDKRSARIHLNMGEEGRKLLLPLVVRGESRYYLKPEFRDRFMNEWDKAAVPKPKPADADAAPVPEAKAQEKGTAALDQNAKPPSDLELRFYSIAPRNNDSAEGAETKNDKKLAVVNGWVEDVSAEYERKLLVRSMERMLLQGSIGFNEVVDTLVKYPDLRAFMTKFLDPAASYRLNPVTLQDFVSKLTEYSGLDSQAAGFSSEEVRAKLAEYDPFIAPDKRTNPQLVQGALNIDKYYYPFDEWIKQNPDAQKAETPSERILRLMSDPAVGGNVPTVVTGTIVNMLDDPKKSKSITAYFQGPDASKKAAEKVMARITSWIENAVKVSAENPNSEIIRKLKENGITLTNDPQKPYKVDEKVFPKKAEDLINEILSQGAKAAPKTAPVPPQRRAGAKK